MDDIDHWRKRVDTQLSQLAINTSCQPGKLLGNNEENPRGHIAAVTLHSGKELDVVQKENTPEVADCCRSPGKMAVDSLVRLPSNSPPQTPGDSTFDIGCQLFPCLLLQPCLSSHLVLGLKRAL